MKAIKIALPFLLGMLVVILYMDKCIKPKTIIETRYDNETRKLQSRLDSISQIYHIDTAKSVSAFYQLRIDTVRQWIQAGASWDTLCKSIGANDSVDCQNILLSRYYSSLRDSSIVRLYQRQRNNDSSQIILLKRLDTLKTERIGILSSKVEKMQQRADKRQKIGRVAHGVAILGGLILLLK